MPKAILSVHDKTGLVEFARGLQSLQWTLIASGGTAKLLRENKIPVTEVADYTGSPEILGGRVKTLHPAIHGGLLARSTEADLGELKKLGWDYIDLVACNLYPFEETVAKPGVTLDEAIENIDIGGVTLIRAAAKNHQRVILCCDPADYPAVLAGLRAGSVDEAARRKLAVKGFGMTAGYDAAIDAYLAGDDAPFRIFAHMQQKLRYGENPHQTAAHLHLQTRRRSAGRKGAAGQGTFLHQPAGYGRRLAGGDQFRTPERGDRQARLAVRDRLRGRPARCLPRRARLRSGLGLRGDRRGQPDGGRSHRQGDGQPVHRMHHRARLFRRGARGTGQTQELPAAGDAGSGHRTQIRIPLRHARGAHAGFRFRRSRPGPRNGRSSASARLRRRNSADLRFAWKACQFVRSNAIVFAHGGATVGIGGGQPNRVDCVRIAAQRAGEKAQGAVMASDAFFPFPDSVQVAAEAGITAVVHPGGSVRDAEAIAAADAAGMAMVVTGVRHFRH